MERLQSNWLNITLRRCGWLCLIILTSIACTIICYLFPGTSETLTNADLIQLPTILLDLQADFANFWDWKLPQAPYYFPDTVAFITINWFAPNPWWAILLFSTVQTSVLLLTLCWIYHELGGRRTSFFLVMLLCLLVSFTGIYTTIFTRLQPSISPYINHLASYIHFGAYLCCLLCLAGSINYLRTPRKYLLVGIVAIAAITTASDLLFAIYFTIPFIVAINLASASQKLHFKHQKVFCWSLFIASFCGYIFNKYFDPLAATTEVRIKLNDIIAAFKALFIDNWQLPIKENVFLFSTIVIPLIGLGIWLAIYYRNTANSINAKDRNHWLAIVFLYTILASCCTTAAVVILGKYTNVSDARYLLFLYYSPGLIALISLCINLENIKAKYINRITIAGVVAIGLISLTTLSDLDRAVSAISSPPDYMSCFDLDKPQAGISEYWWSKPLITFSGRKMQVVNVDTKGKPYAWNMNRRWYHESWQNSGERPKFEFILMKSLDVDSVTARYGKPDRVQSCANTKVWWYDNPEQVYRNLMRE